MEVQPVSPTWLQALPGTNAQVDARRSPSDPQEQQQSTDIHKLTIEELQTRLELAHPIDKTTGLTSSEAAERLIRFGTNEPFKAKSTPLWLIYLRKFLEPIDALLVFAGTISIIGWGAIPGQDIINLWLAVVLYIIAWFDVTLSFALEYQSLKVTSAFAQMLPSLTQVVRDGRIQRLRVVEVVPGDIVLLQAGDKSPADLRVLETSRLKIETSAITGESRPYLVSEGVSAASHVLESRNIVFSSASCAEGSATCIVVETGEKTFIGTVAKLTRGKGEQKSSTLKAEIRRLVKFICILGTTMALVCFAGAVAQHPGQAFNIFILAFLGMFVSVVCNEVGWGTND